jgi:hypothetical protein
VWHGNLTHLHGQRRATMIQAQGKSYEVVRTLVGSAIPPPYDEPIERFVYEPDAALLASGMAGTLAADYGWWTFASTSGYFTGPVRVDDPACTVFEVNDVLPLHVRKLSQYLRERGIGRLEIKHRSIDIAPERLRRELKLVGDRAATLLLTRVGEKRIAILADRV